MDPYVQVFPGRRVTAVVKSLMLRARMMTDREGSEC